MHELLHIIGLCPDNLGHLDLLDLVVANYESLLYINLKKEKGYVGTNRRFNFIKRTRNTN